MIDTFFILLLLFYCFCSNRILNVSYCDITDAGIKALCGGAIVEPKKRKGRGGQCKSLRKLFIRQNKSCQHMQCNTLRKLFIDPLKPCQRMITQKGLQIALKNLPQLEILDNDYVYQALVEMHQNQQPLSKYVLSALLVPRCIINVDLRLTTSICPSISKLELSVASHLTDQELLNLRALDSLHELKIVSNCSLSEFPMITFDGGLAPVLKTFGISLHGLGICIGISVDLGFLITTCPNLRSLELVCPLTWREASPNPERHKTDLFFRQLEKLKIFGCGHSYIMSENLLCILSAAPALTHLDIDYCSTLTDEILQHVFQCHSFPNLIELKFSNCSSVTKKGIDLFMTEENVLEKIDLSNCYSVENMEEWKITAKRNNWNVSIRVQGVRNGLYGTIFSFDNYGRLQHVKKLLKQLVH